MHADVGLIGGTGVADLLEALGGVVVHVPTREGVLRARVLHREGRSLALVRRHSEGHRSPPHRVEYAAMALGLRALGVRACFATAAVGSLHEDWGVGTQVVCADFLDLTGRNATLYDREVVHTDFGKPMGEASRRALVAAARNAESGVYVCANGPRFETPQEILLYRHMGGDVVGMTAATEAILMREAGIDYACLAVVTNLACGLSDAPLDHGEVSRAMRAAGRGAVETLLEAAATVELP